MSARLVQLAVGALDAIAQRLPWRQPHAPHLQTGRRGEEAAYFYLRRVGYVIVARNWRSPRCRGELDLVGWDGDVLCFIEVKTRTTREVMPAEAAVDDDKQRQLCAMAREYLRRLETRRGHGYAAERPSIRFDVISVYYEKGNQALTLFRNAFSMA